MYYYKRGSTYMASHSEVPGADAITQAEYERVKAIVDQRPVPPDGYGYRMSADLTWELYALPAIADDGEEATAEDYKARAERAEAALDKLRAEAESSTVLKALLEKFNIL